MTLTVNQLIRELRKVGEVEMPVITAHDVIHILIKKNDVIQILEKMDGDSRAPWDFTGNPETDEPRRLDVA